MHQHELAPHTSANNVPARSRGRHNTQRPSPRTSNHRQPRTTNAARQTPPPPTTPTWSKPTTATTQQHPATPGITLPTLHGTPTHIHVNTNQEVPAALLLNLNQQDALTTPVNTSNELREEVQNQVLAHAHHTLKQHNAPTLQEDMLHLNYRWLDATNTEPATFAVYLSLSQLTVINLQNLYATLDKKTPGSSSSLLAHLNHDTLPILTPFAPREALDVVEYLHWGGEDETGFLDHIRDYAADNLNTEPEQVTDAQALEHAINVGVLTPTEVRAQLSPEHTQPKATHSLEQLAEHHPQLTAFTEYACKARAHAKQVTAFLLPNLQDYHDEFDYGFVWPVVLTHNPGADFILEMHAEHHQHVIGSGLDEDPLAIIKAVNAGTPEAARQLTEQLTALTTQLAYELHILNALKGAAQQ